MNPKPLVTRREIRIGLAVLWVMLVLVAYYAVQKPLSQAQLSALGDIGLLVAGWIAIVGLANLLGRTQRTSLSLGQPYTQLALQIGLGLGIISLVLLGTGAVGLYSWAVFWGLVLVPLPISLPILIRDLKSLKTARLKDRGLLLFIVVAIGGATLRALAPPTAWDSLVYHLTGSQLYLEAGGLTHQIDLPYLGFPKLGSMLFLLGSSLAGPQLAQLLHTTFAALTLALLPGLVQRSAPGRGALVAAILMAVPSLWLLAGWASVEGMAAFFLLASFALIGAPANAEQGDQARSDRGRKLILAGFFAAMALSSKYSVIWAALGLLVVLYLRWRSFRPIGTFSLSVLIFTAPSLLGNLLQTGNPTYPFFFGGSMWDAHRAEWFSRFGTGLDLKSVLLAPWEATVFGIEGGYFEGHASFGASVGPLLLALAPLALLRLGRLSSQTRDLVVMISIAGAGWAVQLGSSQLLVQTRLLFPVFPFLAALAAIGFDALGDLSLRARFVLGGVLAFVFAATSVGYIVEVAQSGAERAALGLVSETDYLQERLGPHLDAMKAVNGLAPGSKVYFLWEPRSYYCEVAITCEPDAILDRWWHARQHESQASEILSKWKEEGATHVLYRRIGAEAVRAAGFDPLHTDDWRELDHLLDDLLVPIAELDEVFTLYAIP